MQGAAPMGGEEMEAAERAAEAQVAERTAARAAVQKPDFFINTLKREYA